ncbi:MAG TPA: phasin family protein [Burkholderiaceae bacterium]|jgi:phasin family protein|nr:phasin family protein [Burkholderiaceae bacterium]
MFTTPEQFSAAAKTNFEAQIAALTALTTNAFESVTKIVDLNLNAAKASFEESSANAKKLLAAKDPQEFFSLTTAQAQPNAEKAIAYGRTLAGIASSTQAEFTKAAEAHIAEHSRKAIELVDTVSKNAPAGSEQAIALVKSAIGNATAGYEQFSKTAKQATETLQANVSNSVEQFSQNAAKATSRAKK